MKDSSQQPPFILQPPLWFVLLVSGLMVYLGMSSYSQLQRVHYKDIVLWLLLIQSWVLVPICIFYGILIKRIVAEEGITQWLWQGFGRPSKLTHYLDWSKIDSAELYPRWGRATQVKFSGLSEGKKETIWIPIMIGPGLKAVKYAAKQLPPEKVDKAVWKLLERSQKKWYQRIFWFQ